jgi:hypothetical protein
MKKSISLSIISILMLQFFVSCRGQDPISIDPNPVYKACCGIEPVEFSDANKGYVYVPNVFTPNRDGQNDLFLPVYDPKVVEYIAQYTIYQDTTEQPGPILYASGQFDPNQQKKWWDGTLANGKQHIGAFKYTIQFALFDGTFLVADGRACLVQCGREAAEFAVREGCFFGTQVIDGKFDREAPNKEEDCFK